MPYSKVLYENLPLYARFADEKGVLQQVCDAIQPQYNDIHRRLNRLEFFFDVEHTPAEFLDWFGQIVGLSPINDQWLGLGLNPNWTSAYKRRVIQRAWTYWQLKGTEWAVREAIDLWLQWQPAHSNRLYFTQPFGKTPVATPPLWFGWGTPYDTSWALPWDAVQRLGSGDELQAYQPEWKRIDLTQIDQPWSDRSIIQSAAPEQQSIGSAMGPYDSWMHFSLHASEWNKVAPNIVELNPEIWDAHITPTVCLWLEVDPGDVSGLQPLELQPNTLLPQQETVWDVVQDGMRWGDIYPILGSPAPIVIPPGGFVMEDGETPWLVEDGSGIWYTSEDEEAESTGD
jgi:phage tail-like protein